MLVKQYSLTVNFAVIPFQVLESVFRIIQPPREVGNIYVLFRDESLARRFANETCALYRKHGGSASATSAVAPWTGSFRETLEKAQNRLMARKTSPSLSQNHLSNPYWKVCESCGLESASNWGRERILCTGCEKRRSQSSSSPFLGRIGSLLSPPRRLEAPEDFGGIGALSRPENYLGFIYIDVDKLGRFFDRLPQFDPAHYRRTSLLIKNTVETAVIEGCAAASEATESGGTAPFEILLLGGDDAMLVTSAQAVFPFLKKFRKSFQDSLAAEAPSLTFSAGVVWAHSHLPISQYVWLAKQLLRSAKAAEGDKDKLDYLIASESMVAGLANRDRTRTLRPCTFDDFDRLSGEIRKWKRSGFPSSKAHQLYPMAFEEKPQGTLDFLYWLSRLEKSHRELACEFFKYGFWPKEPYQHTQGADLAELWDFVEAAAE